MAVAAINQEKDLVGAFSVITNLRMDPFLLRSYLAVGEVEVTVRGPGTQCIIYAESEL